MAVVGSANNPAGRLLQLVYQADEVPGRPSVLEMWEIVFQCSGISTVMTRLAAALTLVKSTEHQLRRALTTEDVSSFMTGVDDIAKILRYQASNLDQRTPKPFQQCGEGKKSLGNCDKLLASRSVPGFSFSGLDTIEQRVIELRNQLVTSP